MINLFAHTEQFVIDSFTKAGKKASLLHLTRTVYWLKQLHPDADEYMQIAALSHDIERAFQDEKKMKKLREKEGFKDPEFLRLHQERGAEIMEHFLREQGVDHKQIERVKRMIAHHEEGGNEEQNEIKDADSVSFLENNVTHFIANEVPLYGKKHVKAKFDWMYNRISSVQAKEIVEGWYQDALLRLDISQ